MDEEIIHIFSGNDVYLFQLLGKDAENRGFLFRLDQNIKILPRTRFAIGTMTRQNKVYYCNTLRELEDNLVWIYA